MQLRSYLLQLTLTPGISYSNQLHLYHWVLDHPKVPLPLSITLLLSLIKVTPKQQTQITQVYNQPIQQQHMAVQFPYLALCDEKYPDLLKASYQPPLIIFYQGDVRALSLPLVALVGARKATPYARVVLNSIMPTLTAAGVGIVSGLAMGVDALVHQATLQHQGVSIGVIGTGLDVFYPKTSKQLQIRTGQNGLLLSEYPVGVGPRKHHFPARNRIIAGLCQTTVVIEAAKNSGSLITANLALQENRNVLAVPGALNAPMSVGCNELIAAGAGCVLDGTTILREMRLYEH